MTRKSTLLPAFLLAVVAPVIGHAQPLRILSWNVESDGVDPAIIAAQLAELPRQSIYCFQEIGGRDFGRYAFAIRDAHSQAYRYIASNTGRDDRLMILFDSERLALIESRELFRHGDYVLNGWRHRSPLVLVFRDRPTGSEFNIMTVHLARGDRQMRKRQAIGLREWVQSQPRSSIAIGDFNFDYNFARQRGNASFNAFLEGDAWQWVKPDPLVDTNYDDRDGDGLDDYPDSCLDFAFLHGSGFGEASAEVIVREGDFPDDDRTSDHRPLALTVELISAED